MASHDGIMHVIRACIAALALIAAPAAAAPYSNIFVFGDSLVDAGNVQDAVTSAGGPDPAPAAAGYFEGRFTNGPDYTDLLYRRAYGEYMTASRLGGTNYAYGGARAVDDGNPFALDLGVQVANYLTDAGGNADADGLYIINIGGNDIFAIGNGTTGGLDPEQYGAAVIQQIVGQVLALDAAGAGNILVTGIPNATVPFARALDLQLTAALMALDLQAELTLFSYIDFFDRMLADPSDFGLPPLNLTTTCRQAGGPTATNDCFGYFSFDGTHPTAAIHRALAREIGALVGIDVPAPGAFALLLFGCAVVGARRRA